MAERTGPARTRYRFSPLERRGVIAGWRGGQIASVAGGMVVAVLALRSTPSVGGVLVSVVVVAGAVALAFWPIQGRTGEQWLPLVAGWTWARMTGSETWLAPGPRSGHQGAVALDGSWAGAVQPGTAFGTGGAATSGSGRPGRRRVGSRRDSREGSNRDSWRRSGFGAGPFAHLDLVAVPIGPEPGPHLGMVFDRRARTGTAVLAVRGHSFALLGPVDQDNRISAWARVLATLAREGSEIHRVQWTESCLPDDGAAVRRHWAAHAVLGPETAAGRSYRSLVDESAPVTRRHEVLVAVTVSGSRSSRSIRSSGGGKAGSGVVLVREVLALERALGSADIAVDGVLGPGALGRLVGAAFAGSGSGLTSGGAGDLASGAGGDGGPGRVDAGAGADGNSEVDDPGPSWPWPMAVEPHWDAVRTDGTWHATYWIAEWPRVDVTPDFLGPLLFSPLRRTISMTMEPVSPSKAARQVAQARTADIADGELRRRGGFLTTARHSREKESVEERDVELADGHAQFRFTGYVTVTADTRAELVDACAAVEQAAGHSRVELRRLYGEQDLAFACSLPLGRGLR